MVRRFTSGRPTGLLPAHIIGSSGYIGGRLGEIDRFYKRYGQAHPQRTRHLHQVHHARDQAGGMG